MGEGSNSASQRRLMLFAAAAAALAVAVYWNGLHGGFVYSDRLLVVDQPAIRDFSLSGLLNILVYPAYNHFLPVRFISYAVDYRLWGLNPLGFHAVNLALHILNVFLVAFLVFEVLSTGGERERKFAGIAGGAAAALFAVHPLGAESVTWITGRKDVLSTAFSLGATLCYLKSYRRARSDKTDFTLAAAFCMFALALLTKATVIAMPLVFAAVEIFIPPGEGQGAARARIERLIPFFAVDLILTMYDLKLSVKSDLITEYFGGSVFTHFLTISTIPLLYLQKLFWPAQLCVEYPALPRTSILNPVVALSLLMWAGIALWFVFRGLKRRPVALLAAWTLLNLAPVMNLMPTAKLIADRYTYLPAIGFFGLAGCAFARVSERKGFARIAACALLAATVAGLGARTVLRNRDWRSDLSLWQSAVRVEPDLPIALMNLGYACFEAKDYDEAEFYYKKAIEREPKYISAMVNLAFLEYKVRGDAAAALMQLRKAVLLDPMNAKARSSLASILFETGEYQEAVNEMMRAVRSDPSDVSLALKFAGMYESIVKKGVSVYVSDAFMARLKISLRSAR
jgi:protein O-mannosyl-transferase